MTTPETGNSREGKYCPRCRTMTFRDREVCEHCGHQFRTGLGTGLSASPLDAPLLEEAALHRTMQFTLPPLPPRGEAAAPDARSPETDRRRPGGTGLRRRGRAVIALALGALGLALLGAWGYFHYAQTARAARPSPVGIWETTLAGRASQDAHLQFVFQEGGGGAFSWAVGSTPPLSGQAPLHWRLDPDGKLVLSIPPPTAAADPVSGQLTTFFSSHPWLWRVDRPQNRLVIGNLNFTEKI